MNGPLLRVLIAKKFFKKDIEVDALYRGSDLSGSEIVSSTGTFTITGIRLIGSEDVALEGASVQDGSKRVFFAQSLVKIDGMDPARFAASVCIDENGEKIHEGKRRGRKPKPRPIVDDDVNLLGAIG